MKNRFFILYILIVFSVLNQLTGQKVLYSIYSGIREWDIQDCSYEQKCIRNYNPPPSPVAYGITITPKGDVFANANYGPYCIHYVEKYYEDENSIDSCYYHFESFAWQYTGGGIACSINCSNSGRMYKILRNSK